MAKYRDKHSMGRSDVIRPNRHEGWKERHQRRKSVAQNSERDMRQWCDARGLALSVKNDGHHWMIRSATVSVEWWPSTAKAVRGRSPDRFRRATHCHDIEQLKVFVEREIVKQAPIGETAEERVAELLPSVEPLMAAMRNEASAVEQRRSWQSRVIATIRHALARFPFKKGTPDGQAD